MVKFWIFEIFVYLKSSNFDLPGQFGGFQTLSYEKIIRFGIENTPKDALEAIFWPLWTRENDFLSKNHIRGFKMLRKSPPGHLSGCFLYQTELFFQTKASGNPQIVGEGRFLKILAKKKSKIQNLRKPNTETRGKLGRPFWRTRERSEGQTVVPCGRQSTRNMSWYNGRTAWAL